MQLLDKFPIEGGQKDPKQRIIPFLPGKPQWPLEGGWGDGVGEGALTTPPKDLQALAFESHCLPLASVLTLPALGL